MTTTDAQLVRLRSGVDLRLYDDDDRRDWRRLEIVGEVPDATRHQDPDLGLASAEVGSGRRVLDLRCHVGVGEWEREVDHSGRVTEPPHVPLIEKHAAIVGPERLVDALTIEEAMIEDGDHRIAVTRDAAIDVHGR